MRASFLQVLVVLPLLALAGCVGAPQPEGASPARLAASTDCRTVVATALRDKVIPTGADGRPLLAAIGIGEAPAVQLDATGVKGLQRYAAGVSRPVACLAAIGPATTPVDVAEVDGGQKEIESSYLDPDAQTLNPAYRQAQADLDARQRETDMADAAGRQDVLSETWSGLAGGTRALFRTSDRTLRERARTTPKVIEGEPVPYTVVADVMDVTKSVEAPLALIDTRTGLVVQQRRALAERRTVMVADGLRDLDQQAMEPGSALLDRASYRRWSGGAPLVPLETVLAALASPPAGAQSRPGGLAALQAAWPSQDQARVPTAPAPVATALPGVVEIEGMSGRGQGVYVSADKILTAARLIGDTGLVRVGGAGGVTIYGVVDRRDEASGLALVYVQRPGPPVAIEPAASVPAAGRRQAGWLDGAPVVQGGRVVGLVTDGDRGRIASGATLATFVRAGGEFEVAQPPS